MYAETLTPRERVILSAWALKGSHRGERLQAAGVTPTDLASLHASGYLKTLPIGGVYLADGGTLVLGPKMKDRLEQLSKVMAERGELGAPASAPVVQAAPAAPQPPAPSAPKARPARREAGGTGWAWDTYRAAVAAFHAGARTTLRGVDGQAPFPVKPAIGANAAKWARMIRAGKPLQTQRIPSRQSTAFDLGSIQTTWKRAQVERWSTKPGATGKTMVWEWVADTERAAPARVRCPTCKRPIRLRDWWWHGCEKALVDRVKVLGDFNELTAGAKETEYQEAA